MWLDLKDIIEIPGASVPFQCELGTEDLDFPSVVRYSSAPRAKGRAVNTAGLLALKGELITRMVCVCDRCGSEFEQSKVLPLDVPLSAEIEDEGDADVFPVEGNGIDLDEVLATCFILDMDTKFLCREDCKGLCPTCGKNLNEGPCTCAKPIDPRLAVLGQLLDSND